MSQKVFYWTYVRYHRASIVGVISMFNFRSKETVLILVFLCFVFISAMDLALDFHQGTDFSHVAQEAVILALSLMALAWLLIDLLRYTTEIKKLRAELQNNKKPSSPPKMYVVQAKSNLSHVISQQFEDWQLTNSEKEVGWFLLKGFSLKEIAALRETLEKTVRQQASAIYKKAGLNGRHSFSAWFIEDVL